MVKVTLKDGTVVEGTPEEIYALDLFVETDEVVSVAHTFKEGDKVRVLGLSIFGADHRGKIGTFTGIDEDGDYGVNFEDIPGRLYKREDIELVTEVEVEEAPLVVGDYAVVTGNGNKGPSCKHGFDNGTVVIITRFKEAYNGPAAMCRDTSSDRSYGVATADLRKVTDEEVATAKAQVIADAKDAIFTENGRKPNEYRKGDIVKITFKGGKTCEYVGVVEDVSSVSIGIRIYYRENYDYVGAYFNEGDKAEPLTFVESRLDRK